MNFENVEIKTSDGITLRGWFLPHPSQSDSLNREPSAHHRFLPRKRWQYRHPIVIHQTLYDLGVLQLFNSGLPRLF